MADHDARLVALYDGDNPDGPDHDFYRGLAGEVGAERIVDLGCGTGILTVTLARAGRSVVGVDPSAAMLDFARRRDGGHTVRWVLGDAAAIDVVGVDYAVMTGNVAQHIPPNRWKQTLARLRGSLRRGGVSSRSRAAIPWRGRGRPGRPLRPLGRHGSDR